MEMFDLPGTADVDQMTLDVAAIQSSVAYCASLAGGADTAEHGQEEAAVWRTVAGRLERLVAMRDLLHDVRVEWALNEALSVVRDSLQHRLDEAEALVGRVAGPDACLTENDTWHVQCGVNGIAAARVVLEKLVPDVPWDVLAEKVMWHLREYGKLAAVALKDSRPEDAAAALQQLQMLATQTCVEVPHEGHTGADIRDAAVTCGWVRFERLCEAVHEHINKGAWHTTEALRGTATALSDVREHHTHLHAVLGLGDLASTGYEAAAEALREGLSGLEQACVRDAQELAGLRERDDERQQRLAAQLRDSLTVLVEAEGVCWQHIETSVLQEFVRNAHGACVSAVQTLCDRVVRAVKVGTGADGDGDACAQEIQGEDVQLCTDIVDVLHKVHCGVTADTQTIYTEMQVRVNEAAAVAVAEVGRQVDAVVTADGAGAGQRDQAAELVRYIKQLQQQPALSRYSQGGQGLLAAVQQACKERVGREMVRLEQEVPPVCGSADELLAYCTRMCGVMAVVPLGQVLPEMHDRLVAAEAAHTTCVLQRLACIEAVIPASGDRVQTTLATAHAEGKQGKEDPDLQLFYDRLKRQQAARGAAPPPCTLADLLGALDRVGKVQRMVHGVAAQAAQRAGAGLRDYIYGGTAVQRTFADDVCTVLKESMSAVAAACQSCCADTHTEADAGDVPVRLSDHVDAVRRGLLRLKEVEAAAMEGVQQADTVQGWQRRLQEQVVELETWLAVGDAHIADVNAVTWHLLPLDADTDGAILALKKRCTERFVNQFNLDDPALEEAVKAVDAGQVRQRLDFLQKYRQGEQNYKRLQRRWRDRVQELLDSRLPTFRAVAFEADAGQLRKIHESATEVLRHFEGDESHLGEEMLQELQGCKDRAAGKHLSDKLQKSLLDPLKRAVKYQLFDEASGLLKQVDQAEDALRNLLSDGLRQNIESVREQYQQERDALLEEYRNWDVADRESSALMNLERHLKRCVILTPEIKMIVNQKVRVYAEEKKAGTARDLSHLELYLPKNSLAYLLISNLKKDLKAAAENAHETCKMLFENGDYEGVLSVCKQFPDDGRLQGYMAVDEPALKEAVEAVDAEQVRQRLDFLQKKSRQGEQKYKRLLRRWRDRVQELLDSRLPTFSAVGFEADAGQLRKIHESATEVLLHFQGDDSHLEEKMLKELQRCKDRAAGPHLSDKLQNSLLDPLKRAVEFQLFDEASDLLKLVDQAEDALRNLLSDGLRKNLKSVREQYQQERDALLEEYRNWDVADRESSALMNLERHLKRCVILTPEIEMIVNQKVRVYAEEKKAGTARDLSHLELYLPKNSLAYLLISNLKKDLKAAAENAHETCKMLFENDDYEGVLSVCKQFPDDGRLQGYMAAVITQMVKRCEAAVQSRDMDAVLSRLNQVKNLEQLAGTRLSDLENRIAATMLDSLDRVAVALSKHSTIDPADEAVVIAARTKDALWQLVGDRGKPLATEIEGQLVHAQRQLHKVLQDGVMRDVAKLLRAADARANLRTAFADPTAAGENVLQFHNVQLAEHMRRTVDSAVARELSQMQSRKEPFCGDAAWSEINSQKNSKKGSSPSGRVTSDTPLSQLLT